MRPHYALLIALLATTLAVAFSPAHAEVMQCFDGAIDDAQIDRPDREEVERRCGTPDEKDGEIWIYRKSQYIYRLRFDNEGRLYLIQRQHRS